MTSCGTGWSPMAPVEIWIVAVGLVVVALGVPAERLSLPYPIVLVLAVPRSASCPVCRPCTSSPSSCWPCRGTRRGTAP
ncbi:MAG: hypothetical protein ACRYG2_04145 [Janthinobacterium lividum]